MRTQGRLTEWNDERGFGFITPLEGGATVFVHVSAFPKAQRRPIVTDLLTYVLDHDDRGRPRAIDVDFLAPTRSARVSAPAGSAPGSLRTVALASLLYFGFLAVMGFVAPASWLLLATSIALSVASFLAYRADKRAAQEGRWRTQESALHLISLLGGWPGAFAAQRVYHHKSSKTSFQVGFWITVVANIAGSMYVIFATALDTAPV